MNFQIKFVEYIAQFYIVHIDSWFDIWQIQVRLSSVHRPFVFRYLSIRRPFCSVLIRWISVLSVTSPLLVRRGPLRVHYLSGRSPVLVRYVSLQYSSREPQATAASTFTSGRPTDKGFWQIFHPLDIRSRYPVRCNCAINTEGVVSNNHQPTKVERTRIRIRFFQLSSDIIWYNIKRDLNKEV